MTTVRSAAGAVYGGGLRLRFVGIALVLLLFPLTSDAGPLPPAKRVLILHQELVSRPFRARFDASFIDAIRKKDPGIDIYEEALETERFPGARELRLMRDYLKSKYADRPIDVIVVVGSKALGFALDNRILFGNPSIVAATSDAKLDEARDHVTGLQAGSWIQGTIDLAVRLLPRTRQIFVVDGTLDNDGVIQAEVGRQLKQLEDRVALTYLRDLPLDEVESRLAKTPDDSVVFFIRQTMRNRFQDVDGMEALSRVVHASRSPVFGAMEEHLGRGVVGGDMWRIEEDGRQMAAMALRLVAGAHPRDIPLGRMTFAQMIDWRQLERWQIAESRIPPEGIVVFRQRSFFEQYRAYVVAGVLIMMAQLGLIIGLLIQGSRRRRAEQASGPLQARSVAMLRAIQGLMFVLRCDGTYVDFHARDPKSLFVSPSEFLGRSIRDIMPPDTAATLMDALDKACRTEGPVVVEYELPLPEPRYYEARLVALERDRVLSIVRDVTDAKESLQRNRDLAGRLIASQEVERTRIARDLHDGICQEVAAASVDVSYLRRSEGDLQSRDTQEALVQLQRRMSGLAEDLRLLSHGLHSNVLHHIGLAAALQSHCAEVERQNGLEVTFSADKDVEPASRTVALSLFRIGQEALRNAVRHGHARRATVSLTRTYEHLALSVVDDGAGFDVSAAAHNGGLGLVSMEERARLVHGKVHIRSALGTGTTIDVRIPVRVADQPDTPTSQPEVQLRRRPDRRHKSREGERHAPSDRLAG